MNNIPLSLNSTIKLGDGRLLGFAEFGDREGKPVFFFHGFPGSRLQAGDFHAIAKTNHYRLIGIDRPGMGLSTVNKNHTILGWCHDITALADALKINKFSIIGHSGGAPFVMACAYSLSDRLNAAAIVSGLAPTTLPESRIGLSGGMQLMNALVRTIPGFAFILMKIQQKMMLKPTIFNQLIKKLPESDRLVFQNPDLIEALRESAIEAFKHGAQGAAQEMQLILRPWGFDITKITFPLTIWQGKEDKQVPVSHAVLYKSILGKSDLRILEKEAHVSILYNHMREILESVDSEK